jgi:hypothetical protein
MLDAGYQCSIPTCHMSVNLEIDHIEEWSKVKEHRYENLIVLCRNHHGMKVSGSSPRELNETALRIIKQNQMELAGRYGDIERRVLEHFVRNSDERTVTLPGDFDILLMQLLDGALLEKEFQGTGSTIIQWVGTDDEPDEQNSIVLRQVYRLTDEGLATVAAIREARAIVTPA